MVLDTSAIICIIRHEPEADAVMEAIHEGGVRITNARGSAAILAFWRFGKGIHPAGLNFGDCFSYALARTTGEPLLFKGNDFSRTDIPAVLY